MKGGPVLLVIPPASYLVSDLAFPPLGVLYVASALEAAGIGVTVLDLSGMPDWGAALTKALAVPHRAVGVYAATPDYPVALEILSLSKKTAPAVPVILGGPHATIAPRLCRGFDKVVVGEGWTGALEALKPGSPRVIQAALVRDLDSVPAPARHLVDLGRYHYTIAGERATNIITQMGCPFDCVFCCGREVPYYRQVRARSPENVVRELDALRRDHGLRAFVFYDDEFNLVYSRTMALCGLLQGRGYIWRAPVRAGLLDEKLAAAMAESGCVEVTMGVESGSERLLSIARKHTTPSMNSEARRLFARHGIKFKAFLIVGLPGSTYEDELLTKRWLLDNAPDEFDLAVNTPYPGTPQYEHPERFDVEIAVDYDRDVATFKAAPGRYHSYLRTQALSFEEIVRLRDEMDREVRRALGLKAPDSRTFQEHSMGQSDPSVLRAFVRPGGRQGASS